jgi:hypothetical protein
LRDLGDGPVTKERHADGGDHHRELASAEGDEPDHFFGRQTPPPDGDRAGVLERLAHPLGIEILSQRGERLRLEDLRRVRERLRKPHPTTSVAVCNRAEALDAVLVLM